MTEIVLTGGPRPPDGFQRSLAKTFRDAADHSLKAFGSYTAQVGARLLSVLADHTEALDADDRRLLALYLAQTYGLREAGAGNDEYRPGAQQAKVIAFIGQTPARPDAGEFLSELVVAALEDMRGALHEHYASIGEQARKAAVNEARARFEPETERAQLKAAELQGKVSTLEAELSAVRGQRDWLRSLAEAAEPSETDEPAPNKPQPRRQGIEGHTGIYQTATGLEIGWSEDGKQRWESLGEVTLEQATAKRAGRIAEAESAKAAA